MSDIFSLFFSQTISIMAILDPLGVSLMMLSMLSKDATSNDMKKIASKTTLTTVISFFVVLATGNTLLNLFGISVHSLKVMGGVVLILMAIKMVDGTLDSKNQTKKEAEEVKSNDDFAVIPLGIPISFGPGLFATIIIYKDAANGAVGLGILVLAFLVNTTLLYLALKYSAELKNRLGITGQKIIDRLMGLIVGAIAVEFMVGGVKAMIG